MIPKIKKLGIQIIKRRVQRRVAAKGYSFQRFQACRSVLQIWGYFS